MSLRTRIAVLACMLIVSTAAWTQTSENALPIIPPEEISAALDAAPDREGPAPETPLGVPHQQHSQNAPLEMVQAMTASAIPLPGIKFEPTPFSLFGSLGWRLEPDFAEGPEGAFIRESLEFAHQHRVEDGSMHMRLPSEFATIALGKGWGASTRSMTRSREKPRPMS